MPKFTDTVLVKKLNKYYILMEHIVVAYLMQFKFNAITVTTIFNINDTQLFKGASLSSRPIR